MNVDFSTAAAIVVPSVTALIWLIRLEGRVNTNEQAMHTMGSDITYIRSRVDSALENGAVRHRHEGRA